MQFTKHFLAAVLVLALIAGTISACQPRTPKTGEDNSSSNSSSAVTPNSKDTDQKNETVASITPSFGALIEQHYEENNDTVGWLQVPGTPIEDVVLQRPDDKANKYYLRKDFNKNYFFDGVYFADFRATFGDGSREQLGANTCIYGHAMTDVEDSGKYDIKFGPLHDFRNPEYAKEMPYIFFSTPKEDMVFEVMAVFTADSNNPELQYNNNLPQEEFAKLVREQILPRSKYNYNVEIKDTDKFLTLSTCIYTLDNGVATHYPKTFYRYVVMARLVSPDEPLKKTADFTENPDVIIDRDTYPR